MGEDLKEIHAQVNAIQLRNARVEADKAWEVSWTRVLSVMWLTYIIAAVFLYGIGVPSFLVSALVPVLGYFLSTQSLPFIKRWWTKRYIK